MEDYVAINVPFRDGRRVFWGIVKVANKEEGWWIVQVANTAHFTVKWDRVVIVPTGWYKTVEKSVASNSQMSDAEFAAWLAAAGGAAGVGAAGLGAAVGGIVAAAVGDAATAGAAAGLGATLGGLFFAGVAGVALVGWGFAEAGKMCMKLHKFNMRMNQWENRGAIMPTEWFLSKSCVMKK